MDWLTNWDDIIHGTAVFGAAVPFFIALFLGRLLPGRLWIAAAGALLVPLLWFFGLPGLPPSNSDHAIVAGLTLSIIVLSLESSLGWKWWIRLGPRLGGWTCLAWLLYPAWLAEEGGSSKRFIISAGIGASITAWATLVQFIAWEPRGDANERVRITPTALVPPTVALAVLLQFGSATQFAQSAGALAATISALSLILIWKPGSAGLQATAGLWGMLFGLLTWSGWLFAEIHLKAAAGLLLAPLLALTTNLFPPRNRKQALVQLREGIASTMVAALVVWAGWVRYKASGGGEDLGY